MGFGRSGIDVKFVCDVFNRLIFVLARGDGGWGAIWTALGGAFVCSGEEK
jgi:hypothetical protein